VDIVQHFNLRRAQYPDERTTAEGRAALGEAAVAAAWAEGRAISPE
jgi:hypothetical protein